MSEANALLKMREPLLRTTTGTARELVGIGENSMYQDLFLFNPGLETPWFSIAKKPWLIGEFPKFTRNIWADRDEGVAGLYCYAYLKNASGDIWPVAIMFSGGEFLHFRDCLSCVYKDYKKAKSERGAPHQGRDATHWSFAVWHRHDLSGMHFQHSVFCSDIDWHNVPPYEGWEFTPHCSAFHIVHSLEKVQEEGLELS